MTRASPTVLLTGLPSSFLAQKLLPRLLDQHPHAVVKCLVSQAMLGKAREQATRLPREQQARIEWVEGDGSAMDFGMSGVRYLALARSVDTVHHCVGATHAGVRRDVAERLNVRSTAEVLDFALASASGVQRVVHWSSALLSGQRSGRVAEDEIVRPQGFRGHVDDTRLRAEVLMRDAMGQLPITVLRPSILIGDSKTGEIDRMEGPYLLILLMLSSPVDLRVPLPGRGDQPLHVLPIDYVVNAGLTIAADPRSRGRTFHLVDDNPLSVRRVFEIIAQATGRHAPVGSVPTNLATALLRAPGLDRFSQVPRTFLEQLATQVTYDDRNTRELLLGTGLQCPPATASLTAMVDYVRAQQSAHVARKRRDPHFEELEDPLY